MTTFNPVNPRPDFPAMERERLAWWDQTGMVQKYLRRNEQAEKRFSFIDGPITANNPMGVHHAWGRTYKDIWQRFKTMQGYRQRYQNGFDGQGLWVEVEVEKELGFTSKKDIEAFGIDRFVELCKERVRKFAGVQTAQSIRLGYWMDWDNSYHTMSDENNYTIWRFLKVCHERGWLYEGTDVMPWCPRCGTGISNQEIATEGYVELEHASPYLRLPLEGRSREALLVWTTTPWTLSSNVAAAVNPTLTYAKVRQGDETLYLAKSRLGALRGSYVVEEELPGSALVGLLYRGPYDELPAQQGVVHRVIPWDQVSADEGTGIVHIAPGAGAEDFVLGKEHRLAVIAPLDDAGVFVEGFGWLTGRNAAEAPDAIFADLRQKGLLYHVERYRHRYPTCWRCSTELVFRLVSEWFISMKDLRRLIADVSRKVRWVPEFGMERELDWLRNMNDWMISKKRYWGLALPIYKCVSCGHFEVIGSETELKQRAVEGWEQFEGHSPHRPWVDAVKITCPSCGAKVSRIADVGNPWLDAGIVPFSTLAYRNDRDSWQEWFPADWISESFPGQFRNWFYSLLTMSTVLENREPFRCVFSYGLMRDEKGEEMHKSKGNAIWFDDAAEKAGVDAMRWLYFSCNPAANLNFGYGTIDEVRRRFIIPLWNCYSFFVTYANLDGYNPTASPKVQPASDMDRWIISELHQLINDVTRHLEEYNPSDAARRIEEFVDRLSNWYIRRSRPRFWKPVLGEAGGQQGDQDKLSAHQTLYTCLVTITKLIAPAIPFLAEEMYQNLVCSVDDATPDSVHLADWPVAEAALIDESLSEGMRLAMHVASMGRAARSKAGIRVRQPLSRILVTTRTAQESSALQRLAPHVLDELNIKELASLGNEGEVVEFSLRPNLPLLGPKYGNQVGRIRQALGRADAARVATAVRGGDSVTLDGFTLLPEEVLVDAREKPGYAVALEGSYVAAVDTHVTPELADEGMARELVHRIQNMRRSAGYNIADRITVWYGGDANIDRVVEKHAAYIKAETLSLELSRLVGTPEAGAYSEALEIDGMKVRLAVRRGKV
ncbi:MAG: isoleucine--tRNA ligase [Chloroflexi bacterium]|nr:isoleucine--tRNA ligase [Chloroflexota bacterium]